MEGAVSYYEVLQEAVGCRDDQLKAAYRRLRELLEDLCRMQMEDSSLQMADLAARINLVAAKRSLDISAQNRLHTFRLTSNAILNRRKEPSRAELLRDAKTLAFFVREVTGMPIPAQLTSLLPKADATYVAVPDAVSRRQRMRVTYLRQDEQFLYVLDNDCPADEPLKVRCHLQDVNAEFDATCSLLWPQAQLNLLDVGIDEQGVLTPGVIVLEPDYLLDISTLAECFKEYGHHPANYLYNRLSPSENSLHLLLGNIANLFLDEWIFSSSTPDYLACMKKAFRCYALELVACEDLNSPEKARDFFHHCEEQFEHIRLTVTSTFRTEGYRLDKQDAVLEPSYICEPLGVQGRLDYMQRDMSSFIEMKSGKGEEFKMRGHVQLKENHQVQMQLYQALLEYSMGVSHKRSIAYLFYSRYPLLIPARPSWALLRRVIDVRNRIVATEYQVQLHNDLEYTASRLAEVNPKTLREQAVATNFWNNYLFPQISSFQERLEKLSGLERDYFYTLYNFITKELYTSKSGDVEYESRQGASSLWLSTLEEKEEAGEILYDLRIKENHSADLHKAHVVLRKPSRTETGGALPNFRVGDSVVLYQRNQAEDNVTNQMVFKGNIERISEKEVCVRLRMTQRNKHVLPEGSLYALERDYMDTSFTTMFKGLALFPQANQERRDLLLGQRPPRHDEALEAAINTEEDDFRRISLKARAAQDFFLLIGPPGTGKTSRALRTMVTDFMAEGKQLLLLSYTNRAVDEICKMLTAIEPIPDFIRMGSELNCEEPYRPYLIENVLQGLDNRRAVKERLNRCAVFVGTVSTISSKQELFQIKKFDVALIDESTQILEPQLLGILCAKSPDGVDAVGKFVMIGDHKQLPAVVLQASEQSEVQSSALRSIGLTNLKDSLFERLYRCLDDSYAYDMLCRQGRMNVEVSAFANQAFYEGKLMPVGLPHQSGVLQVAPGLQGIDMWQYLDRRMAFLPSVPEDPMQSAKHNHSEARLVARLARAIFKQYTILEHFDPARTLGIITPYRSQIALIRKELESLGIPELNDVMVDTVERFQGSERDVIIYSFCLSRPRQLRFLSNLTEDHGVTIDRKLNVALTRARRQMFLTGVPSVLRLNPIYRSLLDALKE